jgi:hypothetical protein
LEFWRGKDGIGSEPNYERTHSAMNDLEMHFEVSPQCQRAWQEAMKRDEHSGHVCLCGHPELAHKDGGLCDAGINICFCRKPSPALLVSDIRYFYKATRGPHEAHALSLGFRSLDKHSGSYTLVTDWVCGARECERRQNVGPVRMSSNGALTLKLRGDDNHKLICERCLFMKLNGSYVER